MLPEWAPKGLLPIMRRVGAIVELTKLRQAHKSFLVIFCFLDGDYDFGRIAAVWPQQAPRHHSRQEQLD